MKILIAALDSAGYLFPAIGLAQSLVRRGHEVRLVTASHRAPLVSRSGLERVPRGPDDGESFQISGWFLPLSIAIQVKHIEHALKQFPADVLVGSALAVGAVIAAERQRIPLAVLGSANYLWPTGLELLERPPGDERERRRLGFHHEMMNILNAARKLFGMPARSDCYRCSPLLGDLYLLQSVPELAGAPQDFPEAVRFVGSCLWEPEDGDPELDAWLEEATREGRPIVYAQVGRSFGRPSPWPAIVAALEDSDVRIAASLGRADGPRAAPASWFARDHVGFRRLLPHARAVLTGGNSTSILGALTHGLPLLILPTGGEQFEAADSCAGAGVALGLEPASWSPGAIRGSLERVLAEPAFTATARRLAGAFASIQGHERAARLLETAAVRAQPHFLMQEGGP